MLSVGREINLETKTLLCQNCSWQGKGVELPTGLVRINQTEIYLYAYRCPDCGSFDILSKGKVLAFAPRNPSLQPDTQRNEARTMNDKALILNSGESKPR